MPKKTLSGVFLLIFIFMLGAVLADSNVEYTEVGNFNGHFEAGDSFFNANLASYDDAVRSLVNGRLTPLVGDLDGDNTSEIIVIDSSQLRIYRNSDLEIIDALALTSSSRYGNMEIFDIDGDGKKEIIVAVENVTQGRIEIIEYNGSVTTQQNILNISTNYENGEIMVKCGAVDSCVAVFSQKHGYYSVSADVSLYAVGFNSTGIIGSDLSVGVHEAGNDLFCLPKIREIQYIDYDNDNDNEFIFSFVRLEVGNVDEVYSIRYLNFSKSGGVSSERVLSLGTRVSGHNSIPQNLDVATSCEQLSPAPSSTTPLPEDTLSSPLVYNIDGAISNGLETALAYMVDNDEYNIRSYLSSGSTESTARLNTYPALQDADGRIVSNLFLANVFPDDENSEVCVMGQRDSDQIIDVLCISELVTSQGFDNNEYFYSIDGQYNISRSYGDYNIITHSILASSETTEGSNLDEILNSYGVFNIVYEACNVSGCSALSCSTNGQCQINRLFENPVGDSAVISVDSERVGREDLIALTTTNLWYIDDGYSNSPAEITSYRINPCIDSTWKLNTSVEVRIVPTDEDGDTVRAGAIIYEGELNEVDSNYSAFGASGTTFTFSFTANATTSSSTLQLYASDSVNVNSTDTIDLTYSVSSVGVEHGDCFTDVDVTTTTEAEESDPFADLNTSDNIIINGVRQVSESSGLGYTIIWLFIMVIVGFFLISFLHERYGRDMKLDTVAFLLVGLEVIMFLVGLLLGFISVGVAIVIIIFGLIGLVVWAKNKVSGNGNA